jgi:hypothetical protein
MKAMYVGRKEWEGYLPLETIEIRSAFSNTY